MAANSAGVEWTSIIKPILAASYGSNNTNDIFELVKAINKSETELLNHEEEHDTFYTAFVALAADYISTNATYLSKNQVGVACQASRILLQFLVSRLETQSGRGGETVPLAALSPRQLVLPIRALCSARSCLPSADIVSLTAVMKNAKLPPHIKTSTPSEKEAAASKEPKRARSDLTANLLEQLTTPLQDFTAPRAAQSRDPTDHASDSGGAQAGADASQQVEATLAAHNVASLQALRGGEVLMDVCAGLPHLARYLHKYRDAVARRGFSLPATHSEASLVRHSLQSLVGDLTLTWHALSLPVLEPLTPDKLEKLSLVSMAALHCAVSTATASSLLGISAAVSPKCTQPNIPGGQAGGGSKGGGSGSAGTEDDSGGADCHAVTVVEKALAIFSLVSAVMERSTRAGGHVLQNHLMLGAWVLAAGLQTQLSATSFLPADKPKEDKGKSPSKATNRINLMKVQQGFGVLSVALASQALSLMASLLADLQVKAGPEAFAPEPASLDIPGKFSALQRVLTVLLAAPLNQLLYYLATISYRKACTLKRIQKHPPEGDTFPTSGSSAYYEDFSSADDDDDSEPILGLWLEETLAPPDTPPGQSGPCDAQDGNKHGAERTGSIVPEKGEPHGYIALVTQIFQLMDQYLLSSKCSQVQSYVQSGLSEQQMIILAVIVRDLDRESARTDTGTISVYFGAPLGSLYSEFSQALTRYTHNLLARTYLTEELQATLLQHLGVGPTPAAPGNVTPWPLQVYSRTLAVLVQVLLLKPQPEKEAAFITI